MKELSIFLDNTSKNSIYEQIYYFIKEEIVNGRIATGEKLPSTRVLSQNLQVSRSTVLCAYDQLLSEGYIDAVPQKGYYVMEIEQGFNKQETKEEINNSAGKQTPKYITDFSPNGIETSYFPFNEWKKYSKTIFLMQNQDLFNSGNPKGDEKIRKILGNFLSKSRGVKANSEQIIIGSGNENLINILSKLLAEKNVFAIENPTYVKSYKILNSFAEEVISVSLDENGISIDELKRTKASIVYVTPSHQYPLGIIMSIKRRMELLNWAYESDDRYIIEDDYDSEFRYKGKPIPSLQSIDTEGKVIYLGTFSKSVSPAIRMSYMVLPVKLQEKFDENSKYFSNTVSRIDQKYMEMFMESGAFERHLNRMRTIYKGKHEIILDELKTWKNVEIEGENAGAHILVKISNGMTEAKLVQMAEKNGIKVYALSEYYIDEPNYSEPTVIIGFAKINTQEIRIGLKKLKEIWKL